jgi:hypothetical protein
MIFLEPIVVAHHLSTTTTFLSVAAKVTLAFAFLPLQGRGAIFIGSFIGVPFVLVEDGIDDIFYISKTSW